MQVLRAPTMLQLVAVASLLATVSAGCDKFVTVGEPVDVNDDQGGSW